MPKFRLALLVLMLMLVGYAPASAQSAGCGLASAAFCDTFDAPAGNGNRSGQLNGVMWGVSRTTGNVNIGSLNNAWSPTQLQTCTGTPVVTPPNDVVICNGQLREATNDGHTVTTLAMYPKQPFDFAGRTGVVAFDVSNDTMGTHDAWPEFWMSSLPVPAPFSHFESWISLPQDGFGVRFAGNASAGTIGSCPNNNNIGVARWTVDSAVVVRHYVEDDTAGFGTRTALTSTPLDCVISSTGPNDGLNHVELHIQQNQIDVYATDAGTTSPLKHIAVITNANLSLTRGLIWIEDSHYNAAKALDCGCGPHTQHTFTWDNVGFDGPIPGHDLSYDALDNTSVNGDGTVNLGKVSGPGGTAAWNVLFMPSNPTADVVRVLFNFFDYTNPSTFNVSVNNHAHSAAWPYPDGNTFTWRTMAVTIPISDLVAGTNVVTLGSSQAMITSNVNIVLVNPGGTPTPTPTAVPTSTATPTATPTIVPTATPTDTPMPTATATPTVAPTDTPTPTSVPTDTSTPTVVPTDTPTPVPTDTATPTPVVTATVTATPVVVVTPTCFVETVHNGEVEQFSRDETFCSNQ